MAKIIESVDITTENDKYIAHLKEPHDLDDNGIPVLFFEVPKSDDGSEDWKILQKFLDDGGEIQNRLQMPMAYFFERAVEYPQVKDQLDMIYHAIDKNKLDKTSDFYKEIKKVKDALPKPSE